MSNRVYSGSGSHNKSTCAATYTIYLPSANPYTFKVDKVYNFSTSANPNTILVFMKINGSEQRNLTGNTNDSQTFSFNISDTYIGDVTGCIPLDLRENLKVIVMHDDSYDANYAVDKLFNATAANLQLLVDTLQVVEYVNTTTNAMAVRPRKAGLGISFPSL